MITPIILAAGKSSRMGEQHKLLLDFGGKTLVERVIENVARSNLATPILVYSDPRIRDLCCSYGISMLENENSDLGMSSSMKLGLSHVPLKSDGVIFVFGDMPLVSSGILNQMLAAFEAVPDPQGSILAPYYRGHRRLPNIYGRWFFPKIFQIKGDIGPRFILRSHMDRVYKLDFLEETPFFDVDSPEDYQKVLTYWKESRKENCYDSD